MLSYLIIESFATCKLGTRLELLEKTSKTCWYCCEYQRLCTKSDYNNDDNYFPINVCQCYLNNSYEEILQIVDAAYLSARFHRTLFCVPCEIFNLSHTNYAVYIAVRSFQKNLQFYEQYLTINNIN